MDALLTSLAYKYVALLVLLIEVNQVAEKVECPASLPIRTSMLTSSFVAPPRLMGIAGNLTLETAFFGALEGRIRYYQLLQKPDSLRSNDLNTNQMANRAMEILGRFGFTAGSLTNFGDTNFGDALLNDLGFPNSIINARTGRLEKISFFWGEHRARKEDKYPIPEITLVISNPGAKVLKLRFEGSRAPSNLSRMKIDNIEELLNIPDEQFLEMSLDERDRLFRRCVGQPLPRHLLDRDDLDAFLRQKVTP